LVIEDFGGEGGVSGGEDEDEGKGEVQVRAQGVRG